MQVLTATVERLTRQNQVLEEQLHWKAGNNIAEDLEDSSAERRDREGPEGSNAPSRLERQNVSIPSLVDATPPPVFAEIQAMKEQMEVMMNALKGRVSSDLDDLVNRTDSSFTTAVNSFPLPHKFRMPHVDSYDGVKDPLDHLKVGNNITEDLEDSNSEWRDREGPEGSNAPSRLERQNVSIPSLVDVTPPPVFAEIQAMKEQMEVMMNALKGRVSSDLDDLVNRTDSLFTVAVNSFPLPHKFRMPHIDSYDGVKDPLDHLKTFKTLMHLQGTTLKGAARIWFSRLTPNSVSTFKELSAQFTTHFIGGHRYKKSTAYLMSIKQREDETLRSYISRFNKEALSIDKADDKILVVAFTNGLLKGKSLFSLYKNDLNTMSEVLYRATKYMNAEDALSAREEKPRKRESEDDIQ